MLAPLVSIVIPSFNQGKYIRHLFESIRQQTYTNIEVLLFDNRSSDDTLDGILENLDLISYAEIANDDGQTYAINKGFALAKGDFVCWQNSDDLFYPEAISQLVAALIANPNIDVAIGNINIIDEHGEIITDVKYVKPTFNSVLSEGMVLTNQAALFRKSVLSRSGFLDNQLQYGFDYDFFLRLLINHRFLHINKTLGALRYHSGTKSNNYQSLFESEYRHVRGLYPPPIFSRRFYLIRRAFFTILNFNFRYLVRGFARHLKNRLPVAVVYEFAKYLSISIVALVVDYGVYFIGINLFKFEPVLSGVVGYSIGLFLSYLILANGVFLERKYSTKRKIEFILFFVSGILGLMTTSSVLYASTTILGVGYNWSKLLAVFFSFLVVYFFRVCYVFVKK